MPWTRKCAPESFAASSSKTRMNSVPISLRLASGSVTPASRSQEPGLRVDGDQRDLEGVAERGDDLLPLALAHQPVVDEHAGQLVADRAVHEQRRDRGVDAAREAADRPPVADLGADPRDLLIDDRGRAPASLGAADVLEEGRQDLLAERRVDDLRVELDRVDPPPRVLEGGDRRGRRGRELGEAGGSACARCRGGTSSRPARAAVRAAAGPARAPSARSARTRRPRLARRARRASAPSSCMP